MQRALWAACLRRRKAGTAWPSPQPKALRGTNHVHYQTPRIDPHLFDPTAAAGRTGRRQIDLNRVLPGRDGSSAQGVRERLRVHLRHPRRQRPATRHQWHGPVHASHREDRHYYRSSAHAAASPLIRRQPLPSAPPRAGRPPRAGSPVAGAAHRPAPGLRTIAQQRTRAYRVSPRTAPPPGQAA